MSAVEMEVFTNAQLIIMTLLMFLGGEVFTSLLGLQLQKFKKNKDRKISNSQSDDDKMDQIELGVSNPSDHQENEQKSLEGHHHLQHQHQDLTEMNNTNTSFENVLTSVVGSYLLLVHFLGSTLIYTYFEIVSSAKKVLREKGLNLLTFSIFTTVSTFANCGFVPTNENMMIFKKNSGLLLIMIPQVLLGNTLYPACLRCFIWFLHKITKRYELKSILIISKNPSKILGYDHLFSSLHATCLAVTVAGFLVLQFVVFVVLEWNSEATSGLSGYEKVAGSLFEVLNSRHSGESVFDLSLITPAMIVIFVIMMYLPPYTCFFPIEDAKILSNEPEKTIGRKKNIISYLLFSQLTYLSIFIILICVAERDKLKEDPLNFSLLNIIVEVISAYGNVGFSMGYSCKRQIKASESCRDASYGFVGKWSDKGKLILIIVMFFGRLKKFNLKSHKVWRMQ